MDFNDHSLIAALMAAVEEIKHAIKESEQHIMSQLGTTLAALDTSVQGIKTSFDNFVAQLANAPLPPDAQAALTNLQNDIGALATDVSTAAAANTPPPPATT